MSGDPHDHGHGHDHHHHDKSGRMHNLESGDYEPLERIGLVLRNLARRFRGGRPHACCGNYGEPGC